MKLIDLYTVKQMILAERDKIPRTVPAAPYELVKEKPYRHGDAMRGGIRIALRCLESAPAVDAVEVVRCCKCKHYNLQLTAIESETMCCTINAEYDPDVGVWYGLTAYPPADFYCADGERRTE